MEGTITTGTARKMSQRYICPAEYTSKTTNRQLTLKETKFGVRVKARVSFRFWPSVYFAGQKYRWLIFLVVSVVI